jgi:hypothetical protein
METQYYGLYEIARFPKTVRVTDGALIRIIKKNKKKSNSQPNSQCFVVCDNICKL